MSTSTTTPGAAAIEEAVFATLPGLIGLVAAGRLGPINVTVQHALITADTDAAAEIDKLHGELDALENSNPLVVQGLACLKQIASVTGINLPSEDALFAAVKAAVHDVLSGLKPPATA